MSNDITGLLLLFIKCRLKMRGASAAKNSSIKLEKLLMRRKIFFAMSQMTKLTLGLTLNDPHDDA